MSRLVLTKTGLQRVKFATSCSSTAALAQLIGVRQSDLWRVISQVEQPKGSLVAAILTASCVPFDEVFAVVPT